MKTMKLVEIENVQKANRTLKNLLERTRTEIIGIGLFYGKAGLGKTRWASKIAQENKYVYLRLEVNKTSKMFLQDVLKQLRQKTMPYYEPIGNQNALFNQVLEILQNDINIVLVIDEIEYAFQYIQNKSLGTIRVIMKYIDAIERIARKLKKSELKFEEIRDIIALLEA